MQPEHVSPDQQGNSDELSVLAGQSLGQYRLIENLGSGTMATVFKAYQPSLDRYVAIKVLHASYASDPVFAKHFVYDARLAAKLAHPNLMQIHDVDQQGLYIVMEYAEGGTLLERLQKVLPLAEAVSFVIQASEALQYAHRHRIIHRNVKPSNMLIRQDGSLLLSDLGTTEHLVGKVNRLRARPVVGTPQYLSPEQGTGQTQDHRSDIYSLGIVLFHCLTGHTPFHADSSSGVITKHLLDPLPIEQLTQEQAIPDPIVQIILKMTAKQPQERYQSADAVI